MRSQPDPDGPSSFAPLGRKQQHPKPPSHNSRRRQPRSAAAATSSSAASSVVSAYILRPLLFVLAISTATAAATSSIPFGYQSTQSSSLLTGSTYAASAAYDPVSGILYVTGATYEDSLYSPSQGIEGDGTSASAAAAAGGGGGNERGSDCYLTALALPSNPTGASGIITKSLGEAGISEACTAIALLSSTFRGTSTPEDGEPTIIAAAGEGEEEEEEEEGNVESSHLLVLGHTGPNGLLTDLRNYGTDQSTTYGYGLDLTISARLPDGGIRIDDETGRVSQQTSIEFTTDLLGGKLFHEEEISYPIAVAVPTALSREVEEGDEMMGDGYGASRAGPEFVYVLLQTSDVDPTAGWGRNGDSDNNNFGFGTPEEEEENNNNGVDNEEENGGGEEEEEEDPTVPSSGGTSLTIKKLALTSTGAGGSSSFSSEQDEAISQTNSMVGQTMIDQWTQQYAPLDGTAVSAADLLYVPRTIATSTTDDNDSNSKRIKSDVLLMAGSTRGFGPTFGQSNADGTYDTDGFVTLLDPSTGLMIDPTSFASGVNAPSGRDSSPSSSSSPLFSSSGKGKTSLRIKSTFDGHDVIYGLCIDESETDNVDSVYIVGSTTGTLTRPSSKATTGVDGSLQINTPSRDKVLGTTPRRRAFVMKLNLRDGLQPEWVREYESEVGRRGSGSGTDAYATGCAVSSSDDDGSVHVYVGGVVTDGGRITGDGVGRHRHFSSGGDDIFLVRMDGQSGKADWARQIGSRGHDRLASRGGVVLDSDGGAILVGTTGGSLMRSRDDDADPRSMDAFVMSVSKFGEAVTPVDPAMRSASGECYFVSDPTLYLVIVSVVSALCAFLLGHALRQRQALAKIIKRYSTNGREVKGTVVKKNKTRWCDVASRHILVRYRIPSSSGGRLIKRIDNLSKDTHRYLMLGSLINIHIIPGHDKSGVALQELGVSLKRLWRDIFVIGFLLLASFGMSLVFATCLPWYGWVIATVPSVVTASLAWLLWRNAYPNMELVFIHGEGCIPSGRMELSAIEGLDDFTENDATDNDQTDDDTSSPNNNDVVWLG